jgi:hypothetical protein
MGIDRSALLGGYAGVVTLALAWLVAGGAAPERARFREIDVERINVREPDGTLRLAIAGHARIPGLIVDGHEWPHPNRPEAGMIFFNDEGTENGGLVFDGSRRGGRPTNGGSLTFDRWHQDQTVQLMSTEDGPRREAGLRVIDRPDRPLDMAAAVRAAALPPGPARTAAGAAAGGGGAERARLGRRPDGTAELALADAQGRPRLTLRVAPDGAARIAFHDATGRVTRVVEP